ncbi:MAG: ACT domain-containing protein [Desulfarculaceae bacterium]|jgi:predicted amino acid-binding ACT domain protein
MDKERVFVVVIGTDQKGIIARISTLLTEYECNIEDVQQKVMDGTFVMTMLADASDCPVGISGVRKALEELGKVIGLTIMVHNESVIKAMHRV